MIPVSARPPICAGESPSAAPAPASRCEAEHKQQDSIASMQAMLNDPKIIAQQECCLPLIAALPPMNTDCTSISWGAFGCVGGLVAYVLEGPVGCALSWVFGGWSLFGNTPTQRLETAVGRAEGQAANLAGEVANLTAENARFRATIDELRGEITNLNGNITTLGEYNTQLNTLIINGDQALRDRHTEFERIRGEIQTSIQMLQAANATLNQTRSDMAQEQQRLQTIRTTTLALQGQLTSLTTSVIHGLPAAGQGIARNIQRTAQAADSRIININSLVEQGLQTRQPVATT